MSKTPLPPQAYTKDTLSEAFEWLNQQPDSLKSQVKTTDSLVSLFLRRKRMGEQAKTTGLAFSKEPPASIQSFKSDLKDLADGLKQFEGAEPETQAPKTTLAPEPVKELKSGLDPKSLAMVEWAQARFNLSSQEEAQRMLLTLGFEQISKAFPKG